ncbi:MAG TPA: hypothetical protein VMV81_13820 [Phycisphaerae bacterium]|nr:hypothetical protein [Phycisphaerae bacterium]
MWRGWCDDDRVGAGSPQACDAEFPDEAGEQPMISGLDAGIIPQRAFPLRRWFYANPLWYYHTEAAQHRLRTDAQFYELVDPDLRELCQACLAAGVFTTPSCQGHFYSRERFVRVWDELSREADAIRGEGLVVRDSETDCPQLFQQADYELPWYGFESFLAQAFPHQHHGYIGIAVPAERSSVGERLRSGAFEHPRARIEGDGDLSRALGLPVFSVQVDPESPEERDEAWAAVTEYIKGVLAGAAAGEVGAAVNQ